MTFKGELRPYQLEASALITSRGRALLALDLGTGKTVVSLHAIEALRDKGEVDCALLIMSSSLTVQWANRISEFTDQDCIVIDGSMTPAKRKKAYQEALQERPSYVVMGLRQVVSDTWFVEALKPELALVDEVTSIKNFRPQQTKTIKKSVRTPYRIGLTAEPIENGKAEEVFSIMEWIDDSVFGNWRDFEADYIDRNVYTNIITGYRNVDKLHARLMTACVNKRKDDPEVADFMPTVEEYNVHVDMDPQTKELYDYIARDLLAELRMAGPTISLDLSRYYEGGDASEGDSSTGRITSRLLALHLLLDDPQLLRASAEAYDDPDSNHGSKYASQLRADGRLLPEGSHGAKLDACVEIVEEYMEQDLLHKVIVFCRFKGILPLLADRLDKYGPVLFHGGMNGKERAEAIAQFGEDPDTRLFLSSDAGGYGVDLFMASHLINYDRPLSSGALKQRNGRHVRASSTFRNVYIDNLIVADSVEEYQGAKLDFKNKVAGAIVGGRMSVPGGKLESTARSLTKFLEDYLD
ncbi:DNA helicase [Streptomyces phage LuckySocke]|jgi:SNF2 family DNA or RNA helicase|nr:DNA helicase [Streptomyces phage Alone3]WPH58944.1 DNA helicase [Streptomyces phage LuckySocke]